ncbi:MAG TPA: SDR family oxidoreductase [Alphaproteobacteria bacterium]|nr:SDR family oxidoreductase [Alphaproteobacteria bacterium]
MQQRNRASQHHYPSLAGRNAIVTGGGRGLGRVMALALIEQGANVMITGARAVDELAATEAEARALGAGCCASMLEDVSEPDACERVARAAQTAFGSVDVLVNNAARGPREQIGANGSRFWESDISGHHRMLLTNLAGPFLMARACVPGMIARKFGRIINISTSRPTMVRVGAGPYGPLKAALEASTRIWAVELKGTGVTVNVLLPGGRSDTPAIPGEGVGTRAAPFTAGEGRRGQEGINDTGFLPPAIMAPPLLWLASDESNGVTGRRFVARDWSDAKPTAEAVNFAEADRIEWPHII